MPVIEVTSLSHPGLEVFAALTDAALRAEREQGSGIFIAESPKVIHTALQAGCEPLALLCERRHLTGDAAPLVERLGNLPVYTGERRVLASLTGYTLTRGVLCAMRRPRPLTVAEVCRDARRVVVIDDVSDTTNVGAIFRSAAALGIDGALLSPTACDPLNRRAVRVSMGAVCLLPWARLDGPLSGLHEWGFTTAAMALTDRSVALTHPALRRAERLAIVVGSEGYGLPAATLADADYVVRIPMARGIDSLNVAAAAAIALWELRVKEA